MALVVLALALVVQWPGVALAADPPVEAIHLSYVAPPVCPVEADLVSAVGDMGGTFREAEPSETARSFDVVVSKTPGGFTGSLSARTPAGDERVRTVTCPHCASVVRALGLVMAMTLAEPPPPAPPAEDRPPPPLPPEPPSASKRMAIGP